MVQTPLFWEDSVTNLYMLSDKVRAIGETDLVVLPETFTAGFSMNAEEVAQPMDGSGVNWMRDMARKCNTVICGSLVIAENNTHYNRLIWMRPDGTHEYYDKRHLFRMANEHDHFSGGTERKIVELNGWRINLQVCYDLRFPVWSRNRNDYDVLLYVANWPEARRSAWITLLQARAHENQCYVIGVNRIGEDGKGITYSGDSMVVEPKGAVISRTQPHEDRAETVRLMWAELADYREKFPLAMDADDFEIKL